MAPNLFGNSATLFLEASQNVAQDKKIDVDIKNNKPVKVATKQPKASDKSSNSDNKDYKWKIVWRNVIAFVYLHVGALYGLYYLVTSAKFATFAWSKYQKIATIIN